MTHRIKKRELSADQLAEAQGSNLHWCPPDHHFNKYGDCLPNYPIDEYQNDQLNSYPDNR